MNIPFSLKNKTILITGASSGIGFATAVACNQMGANLIITGRNEKRLMNLYQQLNEGNNKIIVFDFEKENLNDFVNQLGIIDGIVHSAGVLETIPFVFTNEKKLEQIMNINFFKPFNLTQSIIKLKKLNKGSSIVFVSSISGISTIGSGISAYSASKGAISATIRVMALELAVNKIRVNAVCPGMVKTEMNFNNGSISTEQLEEDEKRNYPLGYGNPEDIAYPILFLLSEQSKWITGSNLIVDGGASIK